MANTALKEKEENTTKSSNMMYIQKVKINNNNTATISYKMSNDLAAQEVLFTGKDQKITMNAIRLDYDKSDFLEKALYSVKYAFNDQNNAVINISTPLLPIYKEGMENTFCISGKDEEILHAIIAKAKAYIAGETRTKQMKLVVDNTNEG